MNTILKIQQSNRWCVAETRARFSLAEIRREILHNEHVNERFTLLGTLAPACDLTLFKAYTDGKDVLIAAAIFDTVSPTTRVNILPLPNRLSVEIFFAPWNDELGWFQFCFQPDGRMDTFHHVPYPDAYSTTMSWLKPRKFHWEEDPRRTGARLYWLFAWFPQKDVFRNGDVCGFNVARYTPPLEEFSTWNHISAIGLQDATSFGKLHLKHAPATLQNVTATLKYDRLVLSGTISDGAHNLQLELVNPNGEKLAMVTQIEGDRLHAWTVLKQRIPGRYRVCPLGTSIAMEPEDYSFDLVSADWARKFQVSVMYDVPGNIAHTHYYTHQRIGNEFGRLKDWGIQRLYWLEYGPLSGDSREFYDGVIEQLASENGHDNVRLTRKYCDDLLRPAAQWAKKLGMDFFGVFKPFDMPHISVPREWTMRRHPDWRRHEVFPITRIILYSANPIPAFASAKLKLWTSRDNLHYAPYRKPFRVTQGKIQRPNYRWTPAGKVAEAGSNLNWHIEISNLNLDSPFLALEIEGQDFTVSHRVFAFAEAWSEGQEAPVALSNSGDRKKGFVLGNGVWNWANQTASMLNDYSWKGGPLGMVFREEEGLPCLLDPGHEATRKIWLDKLRPILESEADGIDIRTLGHHNIPMSYLANAFAEPVREAFRQRYGREVEPMVEDYTRIRKLRGEMYTQFLREAKALASRYKKKLSAHLEWGIEVPANLETRMAMELDWRTWIGEKIVDEVTLRGWGGQNSYVQRQILPLARRMNVPVHVISHCLKGGIDYRAMEVCEQYVTDACITGLSGYCLYQSSDLIRMNAEGIPMPIGYADEAIRQASRSLNSISSGTKLIFHRIAAGNTKSVHPKSG